MPLMTSTEFKKGLERVLRSLGFQRAGKALARSGIRVLTLVALQKSNFGDQWWINIGFWLEQLGGHAPDRVELSHLYYRLESLFPEHRETILVAGDLDEPEQPIILVGDAKARDQRKAYEQLLELFTGRIDAELRVLGTEEGLRKGMRDGKLKNGLVRKEARAWLLT